MPSLTARVTPVRHATVAVEPIPVDGLLGGMVTDDPPYQASARDGIDYQVYVTDRRRRPIAELRQAVPKVTYSRRDIGYAEVRWPMSANGGAGLVDFTRNRYRTRTRELEVHRDRRIVFSGPVMRHTQADGIVTTTANDPRQYLDDRVFGKADRPNLARGGDTVLGWWAPSNVTRAVVPSLIGPTAFATRLTGTAPDAFDYQTRNLPRSDDPAGNTVKVTGWYRLESDVAPPFLGLGLEVRVFVDGALDRSLTAVAVIEKRGPWVKLTARVHQPPEAFVQVSVRRWAPFGASILWSDIRIEYRTNTGVGDGGDVTELAAAILRTCSAEAVPPLGWEVHSTLSGVRFDGGMAYSDEDATNMLDAIGDWDQTVDCVPTWPGRGRVRFRVGPPPSVRRFVLDEQTGTAVEFTQDSKDTASYVRYQGSDGDEGEFFADVADGLRLDRVEQAPDGTPARSLDGGAEQIQRRHGSDSVQVSGSLRHDGYGRTTGGLVHRLTPGDLGRVAVEIAGGVVAVTDQRIEEMVLDAVSDSLTFTELAEA